MVTFASRKLFLLDYDGTVLPLRRRIDRSFLPPTTRGMLLRLAKRHRVVFVTGRDLGDLRRLAGPLPGIGKVGTHGLESSGVPGLRLAPPTRLRALMRDRAVLVREVRRAFKGDSGSYLQVKRYALSMHFPHHGRGEAEKIARFRSLIRRHATKGLWEFQSGKHMIDLKPKGFSKTRAVAALLKLYPGREALYAGDDRSDLPVLRFLKGKGLRVGIGNVVKRSDCDLWFPNAPAFTRWLGK